MKSIYTYLDTTNVSNKSEFFKVLKSLPPGNYDITIKPHRKGISKSQRGYYRGVILPIISEFTGEEPERLHEIFCNLFLKQDVELKGSIVEIVRTTSGLTTVEAEEYFRKVREYAQDILEIKIPLPNEH